MSPFFDYSLKGFFVLALLYLLFFALPKAFHEQDVVRMERQEYCRSNPIDHVKSASIYSQGKYGYVNSAVIGESGKHYILSNVAFVGDPISSCDLSPFQH